MLMRWLNSQTLSYLLLMPPVWQAICWTVWGPRCSPDWRTACHRLPARHVTSCHRTCCACLAALHTFQWPVRSEGAGSLLFWLWPSLPVPPHCMLLASAVIISAASSPSHLLLSLAGSWNHHLGLRTHSQLNRTPLVNYAALTKEKETVYSPLQVGEKYPSLHNNTLLTNANSFKPQILFKATTKNTVYIFWLVIPI